MKKNRIERNHFLLLGDLMAADQFCSVCILRSIVKDVHRKSGTNRTSSASQRPASALPLAERISTLSSNLTFRDQQDPSEFLIVLLDNLMTCLSSTASSFDTKYLSNPIHFIIGVNMKTCLQCEECSNSSVREIFESVWSVPIWSHYEIENALKAFCAEARLEGTNSLDCSECQRKVTAGQSFRLRNVSPVFFIHLKRFVYDRRIGRTVKLKHFVSYPAVLDVSSFMDKSNGQQRSYQSTNPLYQYQLRGVLVHLGEEAHKGHIHSYVLAPNNAWYDANDEKIQRIKVDSALSDQNAYILCYCRIPNTNITPCSFEQEKEDGRRAAVCSSTPISSEGDIDLIVGDHSPVGRIQENSKSHRSWLFRFLQIFERVSADRKVMLSTGRLLASAQSATNSHQVTGPNYNQNHVSYQFVS